MLDEKFDGDQTSSNMISNIFHKKLQFYDVRKCTQHLIQQKCWIKCWIHLRRPLDDFRKSETTALDWRQSFF